MWGCLMMSSCKTTSERKGTGVGLPEDDQVDNCPVWFRILTHDQSSTEFSWLVTGIKLGLGKVDGSHLLIDLFLKKVKR